MASSPGVAAAAHVRAGGLKVLAGSRAPGFGGAPTLEERGVGLSIGAWRGLGLRKGTGEPAAKALAGIAREAAEGPASREIRARGNLGHARAGAGASDAAIARGREVFRGPGARLRLA